MPTECSPELFGFSPVEGREVVAAFDAGAITSDAGALLLGATDRTIGMMDRFALCFHDVRCPELIEHEVVTLVGQRVFGIALGYEDLNDAQPAGAELPGTDALSQDQSQSSGHQGAVRRFVPGGARSRTEPDHP